MWYSLLKEKNKITIKKTIGTILEPEPLVAWFTKDFVCDKQNIEINKTSPTHGEVILNIPEVGSIITNDDIAKYGLYRLHIQQGNHYDSIVFPNYQPLLESLVKDLENLLCGCPCKECDDCVDRQGLLDITFKTIFYYTLTGGYYSQKFSKALNCLGCGLEAENICLLTSEIMYGNKNSTKFLKKLLATFYLAFYHTENNVNCNHTFVNDIFNIDKMYSCLDKLGIDYKCVEEQMKNAKPVGGDNYIIIENRQERVFKREDFIYTSPIYRDLQNRPINSIIITQISLDTRGENTAKLLYRNEPVEVGQEITMEDIDNGLLKYVSRDTDTSTNSYFLWEIGNIGCNNTSIDNAR